MKKKKVWKVVLIVILLVIVLAAFFLIRATKNYLAEQAEAKAALPGNAEQYSLDSVEALESSPLSGKSILFLGSSVTYGEAAQGCSFADYIGKLDGVNVTKEAVSGTTLVTDSSLLNLVTGESYVKRLEKVDKSQNFDAVVVQLSTNDATMKKNLGTISESTDKADFDQKTITGAIEYIIAYCLETWNCPVIFYTGSYYESDEYAAMVDRLHEVAEKWDIVVIDLYGDEAFNEIEKDRYDFYMSDPIHPTKAGYLEWWTPYIENALYDALS